MAAMLGEDQFRLDTRTSLDAVPAKDRHLFSSRLWSNEKTRWLRVFVLTPPIGGWVSLFECEGSHDLPRALSARLDAEVAKAAWHSWLVAFDRYLRGEWVEGYHHQAWGPGPASRTSGQLSHADPRTFSARQHSRSLGIVLAYDVCFSDFLHRPAAWTCHFAPSEGIYLAFSRRGPQRRGLPAEDR